MEILQKKEPAQERTGFLGKFTLEKSLKPLILAARLSAIIATIGAALIQLIFFLELKLKILWTWFLKVAPIAQWGMRTDQESIPKNLNAELTTLSGSIQN